MTTLVSQAEYARMAGVSRPATTQWKKRGWLVLDGDLVDVEATNEMLRRYRVGGAPDGAKGAKVVKKAVKQSQPNGQSVRLTRRAILDRLELLDHSQEFDWSDDAMKQRAKMAAQIVGWQAVESDLRDDGHWGGFQLRVGESVVAGFGYELDLCDLLRECRDELTHFDDDDDPDEKVIVHVEMLYLLAQPYWEGQKPK